MKIESSRKTRGHLIREVLTGAWRTAPTPVAVSAEELSEVTPLLVGSGAAGLAWWRIRHSDLQFTTEAEELERAFQLNLLQSSFQEQQIETIFGLLRRARVEALLVKGWAQARVYPSKGMRPSGDIDLVIRPDRMEAARALFTGPEAKQFFVDYEHEEFERFGMREWDELCAHSQVLKLGREEVRLMCAEDHLRFLSIHMLRHGAWRPLWLADVAASVEFRPRDFDWERCLGGDSRRAGWVVSALGLAREMLGARVEDTPAGKRAGRVPRWLTAAVLKQWEKPCLIDHLPPELIMTSLRHPSRVARAAAARWPDPIQATIRMGAPVNRLPRLPFQVGEYVMKTATFVARLPGLRSAAVKNKLTSARARG